MKRGERGRGMPGARRVRGSSSGITPVGVHVVGVGREESSQIATHQSLCEEQAAPAGIISVQHLTQSPH